jgi:tetratricopeptide (TPR) repeat protein
MHPSLVDETTTYYPDGQVRDENYEFSAFMGSKMQHAGVYCLDCHQPHTAKVMLPGNWLCMRCHNGTVTNAPIIDPVRHSNHRVFGYTTNGELVNLDLAGYDSRTVKESGGECVNCHMPQTVYMQRHWRHDHGFTIPDPMLTRQHGIPNACNRCHQDKNTDWAEEWVAKWYGDRMDRVSRRRAQAIARAREGDSSAHLELMRLLPSEGIPYWRAGLVRNLGRWSAEPKVRQALLGELRHTNALVRAEAVQSLATAAPESPLVQEAVRPLLEDDSRNVRVAAARVLGGSTPDGVLAASEYRHMLDINGDQPLGQMQKGFYHLARGERQALEHFRKAVEWDPFSPMFRIQLASVLAEWGTSSEALSVLQDGARLTPRDAELRFHLGLAWSESGNVRQAAAELEEAVQLDPGHSRAWYNLGLAFSALSQPERGLEALGRAEAIQSRDPRIPYARATILARLNRNAEARRAAARALELAPDYAEARQLMQQLAP